jgi:hypothetical protein
VTQSGRVEPHLARHNWLLLSSDDTDLSYAELRVLAMWRD